MIVNELVINNFKKITNAVYSFNSDVNIIVGDNGTGKSTILEALDLVLNFNYRGKSINTVLNPDLFNIDCVNEYLRGDKTIGTLPEILIEAYTKGCPEYEGSINSNRRNCEGLFIKIKFDEALSDVYQELIKSDQEVTAVPTEFYKVEWFDFSWKKVMYLNRKIKANFVDPTKLHPTYGKNQYLSSVIDSVLPKEQKALLNFNFRELKKVFNEFDQIKDINKELDEKGDITDGKLNVASYTAVSSIESNLELTVDNIGFSMIGKGEQNLIQTKLALQNKSGEFDLVMLEEPENHLSHMNLVKLVDFISSHDGVQSFITTHSSYVANKLNLQKLCLIGDDGSYVRLKDIPAKTSKTLLRLPGYDTLRAALSKKIILVEGPSDELIIKKYCTEKIGKLPEAVGIDVIVVRGVGFGNYLQIAARLGVFVNVVKDNDGNHKHNIEQYSQQYTAYPNVKFFSPVLDDESSLEPAMIEVNGLTEISLDRYADVALSKKTYQKYKDKVGLADKKKYLREWYMGVTGKENQGGKKVDSAIRIFESNDQVSYPDYIKECIDFD